VRVTRSVTFLRSKKELKFIPPPQSGRRGFPYGLPKKEKPLISKIIKGFFVRNAATHFC